MGYEVDIIGVGKESKSGDAIAIRWGNLSGPRNEQKVVIIDGGFRESGQDVVDHIKEFSDIRVFSQIASGNSENSFHRMRN